MKLSSTKVSFYLPSLRGGGAERVTVALANGLADRGLDVHLVLAKAEGPYLADVKTAVQVIDLKAAGVLASLPRLVSYLRRERPQVMISAMKHANVVAYLATSWAGQSVKLVVTEHNTLSRSRDRNRLKSTIVRALMRPAYRRCHAVVAVSNGVAEDLSKQLGLARDSIQTIYNPIVRDELIARSHEPVPELNSFHRPIVLAAGRLTEAKDYPTLLRAFARLREAVDATLIILGEGELRQELEGLARDLAVSEHVSMPGFHPNPYAWMRKADLLVMSSAWEGLPTVLIEAMACGTRVVSTDCPSGPAEILENGKWGSLTPVGDAEALADKMTAALTDTCYPIGTERAADFSVERAIDQYLAIIKLPGQDD